MIKKLIVIMMVLLPSCSAYTYSDGIITFSSTDDFDSYRWNITDLSGVLLNTSGWITNNTYNITLPDESGIIVNLTTNHTVIYETANETHSAWYEFIDNDWDTFQDKDEYYQENATETQLTGNTSDGDWDTFGEISSGYFFANYTIPSGTTQIVWITKTGSGWHNYTLHQNVTNEDVVSIIIHFSDGLTGYEYHVWYDSDWNYFTDMTPFDAFYEEAITFTSSDSMFNYTIPDGTVSASWEVKDSVGRRNITLNETVLSYDTLYSLVHFADGMAGFIYSVKCHPDGYHNSILEVLTDNRSFYEEQVIFNISRSTETEITIDLSVDFDYSTNNQLISLEASYDGSIEYFRWNVTDSNRRTSSTGWVSYTGSLLHHLSSTEDNEYEITFSARNIFGVESSKTKTIVLRPQSIIPVVEEPEYTPADSPEPAEISDYDVEIGSSSVDGRILIVIALGVVFIYIFFKKRKKTKFKAGKYLIDYRVER